MKDWIENHKLVRRLALLWAFLLITHATIVVFDPTVITLMTGAGATAYGALVGILSTVILFYQNTRAKEDANAETIKNYWDGDGESY